MDNFKEQYDKVLAEKKEVMHQIEELEKDEKLIKYIELKGHNDELIEQQQELYIPMKNEEYASCNHIWVTTSHAYDGFEGRSQNCYGCIKCGLDSNLSFKMLSSFECKLPLDKRIMKDYFTRNHNWYRGINTHKLCDLDLGMAIYSKIKEKHPDIDDETATKYFKIALDNIRNIKVSDERKEGRAKRLSLTPKFNKWGADATFRY